MASRLIRNQLPRKRLRVRVPCPPLNTRLAGRKAEIGNRPAAKIRDDFARMGR